MSRPLRAPLGWSLRDTRHGPTGRNISGVGNDAKALRCTGFGSRCDGQRAGGACDWRRWPCVCSVCRRAGPPADWALVGSGRFCGVPAAGLFPQQQEWLFGIEATYLWSMYLYMQYSCTRPITAVQRRSLIYSFLDILHLRSVSAIHAQILRQSAGRAAAAV